MRRSSFSWLGKGNIAQTKWVIKAADPGTKVFAGWIEASDGGSYVPQFMYETSDQDWFWRIRPYYAEIDVPSTKIVNQGNPNVLRQMRASGWTPLSLVTAQLFTGIHLGTKAKE
jgi:hypothetical protein